MSKYELLSIVIASAALVISLGTLYLQYFHKRAKLVGILVHQINEGPAGYEYTLEYALCNIGNVQLLLKEVSAKGIPEESDVTRVGIDSECAVVPTLLEPSQVKLVRVHLS